MPSTRETTWTYRKRRDRLVAQAHANGDPCSLCGEPLMPDLKWPHPMSTVADHVRPVAHGGTDHLENLAAAHKICNERKSAKWEGAPSGKSAPASHRDGNRVSRWSRRWYEPTDYGDAHVPAIMHPEHTPAAL